jgi:hypothetical protein
MTVRVGVQLQPQHASYAQMRDAWLRAEEMGLTRSSPGTTSTRSTAIPKASTSSAGRSSGRWPRSRRG